MAYGFLLLNLKDHISLSQRFGQVVQSMGRTQLMRWFVSTLGAVGRLTKRVTVVGVRKHVTPWYAAISSTVGW